MSLNWWNVSPPKPDLLRVVFIFPELPSRLDALRYWPMIEEAVALMARAHERVVLDTSEPRRYDIASHEWRAALDPLKSGRLTGVSIGLPLHTNVHGQRFYFHIFFGSPEHLNLPVRIELACTRPLTAADLTAWVTLLKAWAGRYQAAQGLVSRRDDSGYQTSVERGEKLHKFITWSAYQQYVRCLGWATFLGPTICDHLGGSRAVAAAAPCWSAELVGDGVWLQQSPTLDQEPGDAAWQAITEYLRPLFAPYEVWKHAVRTIRPATAPAAPPSRRRHARVKVGFPVDITTEDGTDLVLNVYFSQRPSSAVAAMLDALVAAWHAQGQLRGFPPSDDGMEGQFGLLTPVVLTGHVARWLVDAGSADTRLAVRDLAQRLELLGRETGCRVDHISVGMEGA